MTVQTVEDAIYNILHAVYGEEVRTSLAEALRLMNNKSQADKEDAEAYAVGTRNGIAVTSGDPAYHNNSKYYNTQAQSAKTAAQTAKTGAETAQAGAEAAQAAAETARDAAVTAKNQAVTAKNQAVTAQNVAEAARDVVVNNHYAQILIFTSKTVSTDMWVSSTQYSGYPWLAAIPCAGTTADHVPEVVFNPAQATSGIFAPTARTITDYVRIYAKEKPTADFVIPTILCETAVSS